MLPYVTHATHCVSCLPALAALYNVCIGETWNVHASTTLQVSAVVSDTFHALCVMSASFGNMVQCMCQSISLHCARPEDTLPAVCPFESWLPLPRVSSPSICYALARLHKLLRLVQRGCGTSLGRTRCRHARPKGLRDLVQHLWYANPFCAADVGVHTVTDPGSRPLLQ